MTDPLTTWLYDLHDAVTLTVALITTAVGGSPEEMMMRTKGFYPVMLRIDDEPVTVHIKCMSSVEIAEFEIKMKEFGYAFDGSKITTVSPINEKAFAEWLVAIIAQCVTVPEHQIIVENEDGTEREIRTGAELIAQFGGRVDLVPALIGYIWGEQRVPKAQKDQFRTQMTKAVERVTRFTIPAFPEEPPAPAPVEAPVAAPADDRPVPPGSLFAADAPPAP
jgi:hypothetical protein